jgi:hypothetical protein
MNLKWKTVKRLLPLFCAAGLAFTSASVWEGAAAAAPRGALPDEGYYAATNSFPRNTVVDITNLETGKSIRVIVSSGLDTPGLLATLSEEAAGSIGLQPRSIGRIRMTQPSDPIAFSRFTEGLAGSGDPDYDPQAMVQAEDGPALNDDFYDSEDDADAGITLTPPPRQLPPQDPPASSGDYAEMDYYRIVDVPESSMPSEPFEEGMAWVEGEYEEEEEDTYWDFPEDRDTDLAGLDEDDDSPEKTLYPLWAQGGSPDTPEPGRSVARTDSTTTPNSPPPPQNPPQNPPQVSATTSQTNPGNGNTSWANAWVTSTPNQVEPPAPGVYDYSLVPAEQRPPVDPGVYVLPSEAEVGPIVQTAPAQSPRPEPVIDDYLFIESIEDMRDRTAAARTSASPSSSPSPTVVLGPAPEGIVSPTTPRETLPEPVLIEPFPVEPARPEPVIIVEDAPLPETAPRIAAAPKAAPDKFSVPMINDLEKGKYYLQLGAYSKPDVLESSLAKLDRHYPLSIQSAGSPDKPLYRLLLGPVNLGESGALLQRFKGSGYSDAFVRGN